MPQQIYEMAMCTCSDAGSKGHKQLPMQQGHQQVMAERLFMDGTQHLKTIYLLAQLHQSSL